MEKKSNRKKQLQLYLVELERKRDDLQVSLDWFRNSPEQNDITYFVSKFLVNQIHFVNGVINTVVLIMQ
jgi:hypothetical protein